MGSASTTVQDFLQKYGVAGLWNANDPYSTLYDQIANTYKTNKTPPDFVAYAKACMIARMFLYFKQSPGDCPLATKVSSGNVGADISRIGGFGALGASTVATGASIAGIAGKAVASVAGEAASVIGLAALPFTIWGIFSAHHAQAVAVEQTDLCAVASQVNSVWQNIDAAVASGSMTATQAISYLTQLQATVKQFLSQITQDCNAACVSTRAINCVNDFRTYLYKNAQQSIPGIGGSAQQIASGLVQSNGAVIAGIAAVGAHLAGVF